MSPALLRNESIFITPPMAEVMLEKNKKFKAGTSGTNRPISYLHIRRIAKAMLAGEWVLIHQGVAFDWNGDLADGQHRLMAIVRAGETNPDIAIPMQVTYGVDPESFERIDNGKPRNLSTSLAVRGIASSSQVTSTAKLFHCYMCVPYETINSWGTGRIDSFTAPALFKTLQDNPSIDAGVRLCGVPAARAVGNQTAMSTFYALASSLRPDAGVDTFMHNLISGLGWQEKHEPVYELRKRMQARAKVPSSAVERITQLALMIKAFNKWMAKEEIHALSFNSGGTDSFPRIIMKGQGDGEEG